MNKIIIILLVLNLTVTTSLFYIFYIELNTRESTHINLFNNQTEILTSLDKMKCHK